MKKTLLCLLVLIACLLTACGSAKNDNAVPTGGPTTAGTPITAEPDTPIPTVSLQPEPTVVDPDTVIERGSFYWVFNGAADSIWFFTHQEGDEGSRAILEDTVDMIVEKTGSEIVVYNVKTAPLAQWIVLSDEEIKERALNYPNIRFSMIDAIFTQPLEGSEGETLSFFFGNAIWRAGGQWPVSEGGLFTIPVNGVFSSTVNGIDVSGFCYEGMETDVGLTDQYYLYCATDIGYSLDKGDLGGRLRPWNETARRVMDARKDYRYVGVSYEGAAGWCEILGDPVIDLNIATTKFFCDYTWTEAELWPYEWDKDLKSEVVFRAMEGSGALKRFFPEGKGAPSVYFGSNFLFIKNPGDGEVDSKVNATPYYFMARSVTPPSATEEGYILMGFNEDYNSDLNQKFLAVNRKGKALPLTLDEKYDGTFNINNQDMLPIYMAKLEELLTDPSASDWKETLFEDDGKATGHMSVSIELKRVDGKVEYQITYLFDDGLEKTEVIETGK